MNNTKNKQTCSLARGSFILGILSIAVTPIPAIICGHIALKQIKSNPSLAGRTQAVTGLILGYIFLLFFIMPMFGALFILGPWSKPDFKDKKWVSVKVVYWVHKEGEVNYRKNKRVFEITNKDTLENLSKAMQIKNIKSSSLGANDQIIISMADGEKWQGSFVFKDRISLCLQSDKYYSYYFNLSNNSFFNKLLTITLANEQNINPEAIKKDIILDLNDS
jgi:hypothetical protein